MNRTNKIVLILVLTAMFTNLALAKGPAKETKKKSTEKQIQGEVGGIAKDFIAVTYIKNEAKGEEFEKAFPMDENVKLEKIDNVTSIKPGDTVKVKYEETVETSDTGEIVNVNRKATAIIFIKKGQNE
ncbi:MAG: hypothetical protein KKB22_07430 [Candidatus Omnitrophica bacterium]|nr:hypothetical protein [Candidatus Omnitrophota bacterium]